MDKLEKFVVEHRADFDQEEPAAAVWDQLRNQLDTTAKATPHKPPSKGKIRSIWRNISVAATVALLLSVGGVGGYWVSNQSTAAALQPLTSVAPQYAELEQYYNQEVRKRMAVLAYFPQMESVKPDLEQLDEVFKELQLELEKAPKGTERQIIKAMIANYQAKLDILQLVLEKIEKNTTPLSNIATDEISI